MKLSRIVKLVKEATATIHRNLGICLFLVLMANVYQELGKTCRQNWFRHLSKQKLISSFVKELRESSGLQIFYWTREKVSCAGNDTNVRQAAVSSFVFCILYFGEKVPSGNDINGCRIIFLILILEATLLRQQLLSS